MDENGAKAEPYPDGGLDAGRYVANSWKEIEHMQDAHLRTRLKHL